MSLTQERSILQYLITIRLSCIIIKLLKIEEGIFCPAYLSAELKMRLYVSRFFQKKKLTSFSVVIINFISFQLYGKMLQQSSCFILHLL